MEYKHRPLHEIGEVLVDSSGTKIEILDYTESRYFFKYLGEDKEAKAHFELCYVIDTYFCRDSSYTEYCKKRETYTKQANTAPNVSESAYPLTPEECIKKD